MHFATPHYILELWVRWPPQPLQKSQPPLGPSMDSLCHPCITTTHLSSSFLSLKLPPPPCAALITGISTSLINLEHVQKTSHFQFCSIAPHQGLRSTGLHGLGPRSSGDPAEYSHSIWPQVEMGSVNDCFCNLYLEELKRHCSYWSAARLTWLTLFSACNLFFSIQLPWQALHRTIEFARWMMLIAFV